MKFAQVRGMIGDNLVNGGHMHPKAECVRRPEAIVETVPWTPESWLVLASFIFTYCHVAFSGVCPPFYTFDVEDKHY